MDAYRGISQPVIQICTVDAERSEVGHRVQGGGPGGCDSTCSGLFQVGTALPAPNPCSAASGDRA
jgi:hypothetical protein